MLLRLYRPLLRSVVFIGVTGSCGKTTTKELIAGVLSSQFKGTKTPGTDNQPWHIALTVLRVKPGDQFCVAEIGVGKHGPQGVFEQALSLIRPQIGVVTNIGTDHISTFGTIDAIAAEKSKLIQALPERGTAVLNADDPIVLSMRARCKARVVTYGLAPEATVRAENIRAIWPERLSFTVHYQGQSQEVCTRLCGAHWVPCVLATIAVSLAMGMSLASAVRALETIQPFENRMSPETRSDGVTFVSDDAKAPVWSIPPALEFMKQARAARKIVVIGTISDYTGNSDRAHVSVAKQALAAADKVVFVGSRASKSLKARRHPKDGALQAFNTLDAAHEYLCNTLRPGDLVLLKGARGELFKLCNARAGPADGEDSTAGSDISDSNESLQIGAPKSVQVVIGLGNPRPQFQDSPHNVGHIVIDLVAACLKATWVDEKGARVALVEHEGGTLYLIKSRTYINMTGPVVFRLSRQLRFSPADCVLVHDDMDLPLGSVRNRMSGNHGGHNGVRSVLEAFESTAFRRVKIGVGRAKQHTDQADHVVTALGPVQLPIMEKSCIEAARRVLLLLGWPAATLAQLPQSPN
ncbi:MAG: aminoacyl-tRNA hydrolase [Terriglobia bacterium]